MINHIAITEKKIGKKEWEKFLISIMVGVVTTIGIFAAYAVFTGADILCWNKTLALTVYFILAGGITGIVFVS